MVRTMQKERNAIKWIVFIILMGYSSICNGQKKNELTKEQYQVIEGAFKNSGKAETRLFYQTIDYKSWVHLLYGNYYREESGIGLCVFEDPQLEKAIDQLINHVGNLKVKEFNPKELGKRFVMTRNLDDQPYLSLTEPIIIGDYSFLLFKYKNSESLRVQKKDDNNQWVFECSIPLYAVFKD